jgi:hypothetical protein
MACGSCGGQPAALVSNAGYDPAGMAWIDVNEYGVRPIGDDAASCAPYSGMFQGTTVFLVGYGTDLVKIFLRDARAEAWEYAKANELSFQHINVTELCHERVLAMLGA